MGDEAPPSTRSIVSMARRRRSTETSLAEELAGAMLVQRQRLLLPSSVLPDGEADAVSEVTGDNHTYRVEVDI